MSKQDKMKSVEIYGFVGWISSLLAYAIFLLWALTPESILNAQGIYYFPDRQWALVFPSFFVMTLIYVFILNMCINCINTKPFDSLYTIQDEYSKFQDQNVNKSGSDIAEQYDIPINVINNLLYYQKDVQKKFKISTMQK